ncbi:putative transcriptional regulator SLK2 [Gossypium australe]|uniref:Putative transcriptional regulator SLK2 n=1 Tax=Gossypium australe TaxID=47621 RepID=A0A5B6UDG4_9ROSI|nr:putative transcriptional regulator SLK2 [Gossypium australe]
METSRGTGGLTQSSASSGIFFQGDGQCQAVVNSRMNSPYENSSDSIPGTGCHNLGPVSGDMNCTVLNSVANSGPSVGASSLVTDANSVLSGGPHLQRSSSFNTDSYMRLPASPMSFSSNNMSGSSVIDGSSGGHQEPSVQHMQQSQQLQGASSATSLPTSQTGQVSLPMGPWVQGPFMQDSCNLSQVQKKPRVDVKQEDFLQQQMLQQLLQRQDSMQLLGRNPRLQDLIQQQRLRQQQQMLQSMPPSQRAHLQQQQIQLRQQFQQQGMQQVAGMKRPFDSGVCARRLMQYLYHQRQRPHDNTIAYWRKFVAEYYSTRAKKRWCLSMYNNVGSHALGVFPQAAMDAWYCDICGSKSGRGFEATFEVLPRLNEIKFSSGVIDELLFLDFPRECRFPSGMMMLEYGKAVQESVYEQLRVVRDGQLRIIFTQDLKILSWEFCARRHEELYPRRLVAPQVNQLLQVAQKCHSSISEGGSDSISQQDLQTNSNMFLMAGRQLVKSLELQSLNDLGFSKRYVRCLQIAEVVISMKDLIDFCREQKVGPIDGLKNYPRHATAAKLQMQKMLEMEQLANVQGLPTETNTLNKLMALHPGINNQTGNNHNIVGREALSSSAQTALALTNYQNLLFRQNSMNSKPSPLHQEASSSFNNSNRSPSSNFQGPAALLPRSMHTLPVSGLSSPHVLAQQPQLQRHTLTANNLIQQNHLLPSQSNQALQQKMIRQLLHEMPNNNTGVQQQSWSGQSENASMGRNGMGFGSNTTAAATSNMSGSVARAAPSQSNSYRAASNSDSSPAGGNNVSTQRAPDLPQNLHLQDDIISDIAHELMENGFF